MTEVSITWHGADIDTGHPPALLSAFLIYLGIAETDDRDRLYHMMYVRTTHSIRLVSNRSMGELRAWWTHYDGPMPRNVEIFLCSHNNDDTRADDDRVCGPCCEGGRDTASIWDHQDQRCRASAGCDGHPAGRNRGVRVTS
jgi:hypothetical protein